MTCIIKKDDPIRKTLRLPPQSGSPQPVAPSPVLSITISYIQCFNMYTLVFCLNVLRINSNDVRKKLLQSEKQRSATHAPRDVNNVRGFADRRRSSTGTSGRPWCRDCGQSMWPVTRIVQSWTVARARGCSWKDKRSKTPQKEPQHLVLTVWSKAPIKYQNNLILFAIYFLLRSHS